MKASIDTEDTKRTAELKIVKLIRGHPHIVQDLCSNTITQPQGDFIVLHSNINENSLKDRFLKNTVLQPFK